MTLTLSPEIEKALTAVSVKTGRPPEELASETLREKYLPYVEAAEDGQEQPTLTELFAGRTGLVDSRLLLEPAEPEAEASSLPKQTLAEALVGHIGTQHSERGDLSQNTGKAFTRLMVEKRKAGRL
ncbi:MAG: hypothetical protein ACRYFS_02885 [Janthinobacterium lividum]